MKRIIIMASLVFALVASSLGQTNPVASATTLKVGDTAPDFTLSDTTGEKVKLSDFRGKNNVVLAFYIFAFTGG
jgi:cytochrome oxidase Cu insertion factor (SCO1/SenC/PrrC family)